MDGRQAEDGDGAGSEPLPQSAMDVPRAAPATISSTPRATRCPPAQCRAPRVVETDALSDVDAPGADDDGQLVCAICLLCSRDDDAAVRWKQTPCGHRFHGRCLDNWLAKHDTCPMCRHHVTPPPASRASSQSTGRMAMDVDDDEALLAYDDSSDDDSFDSSNDDSFNSSDDDSFDSSDDDDSGGEDTDDGEQEVGSSGSDHDTDEDAAAPVES